ncbi:hypothetical protein BZA77DRAFT_302788 [Pyronema omphalodes]|nr:hypothetical protein BZA77DRAFT_302788 [Pyronema omphalodes]
MSLILPTPAKKSAEQQEPCSSSNHTNPSASGTGRPETFPQNDSYLDSLFDPSPPPPKKLYLPTPATTPPPLVAAPTPVSAPSPVSVPTAESVPAPVFVAPAPIIVSQPANQSTEANTTPRTIIPVLPSSRNVVPNISIPDTSTVATYTTENLGYPTPPRPTVNPAISAHVGVAPTSFRRNVPAPTGAQPAALNTTGKRKRIVACTNCHKSKKKCSTGTPCTFCERSQRDCVYPDTPPGKYRRSNQPTPKTKKRQAEVSKYQELRAQMTAQRSQLQPLPQSLMQSHPQPLQQPPLGPNLQHPHQNGVNIGYCNPGRPNEQNWAPPGPSHFEPLINNLHGCIVIDDDSDLDTSVAKADERPRLHTPSTPGSNLRLQSSATPSVVTPISADVPATPSEKIPQPTIGTQIPSTVLPRTPPYTPELPIPTRITQPEQSDSSSIGQKLDAAQSPPAVHQKDSVAIQDVQTNDVPTDVRQEPNPSSTAPVDLQSENQELNVDSIMEEIESTASKEVLDFISSSSLDPASNPESTEANDALDLVSYMWASSVNEYDNIFTHEAKAAPIDVDLKSEESEPESPEIKQQEFSFSDFPLTPNSVLDSSEAQQLQSMVGDQSDFDAEQLLTGLDELINAFNEPGLDMAAFSNFDYLNTALAPGESSSQLPEATIQNLDYMPHKQPTLDTEPRSSLLPTPLENATFDWSSAEDMSL